MWSLLVVIVMGALAGFYSNIAQRPLTKIEAASAMQTAESMALYREAVIRYFSVHDVRSHSATLATLRNESMLPQWSPMASSGTTVIWNNYRDADGVIYVYANTLPTMNIQAELAKLSHNSYLVGAYKSSGARLYSPVFGDTGITLAALSTRGVPDNAPVWIAPRR